MSNTLDLARKKMARWRILRILYTSRPLPVGDGLIAEVMSDVDLNMSLTEIRSAIQYLSDRGYVQFQYVRNSDGEYWEASLSSSGVDFVEFNAPNDHGVSRPESN